MVVLRRRSHLSSYCQFILSVSHQLCAFVILIKLLAPVSILTFEKTENRPRRGDEGKCKGAAQLSITAIDDSLRETAVIPRPLE